MAVTAEPLPTRLAATARGIGEVDAAYHIAYSDLADAVAAQGNQEQRAAWEGSRSRETAWLRRPCPGVRGLVTDSWTAVVRGRKVFGQRGFGYLKLPDSPGTRRTLLRSVCGSQFRSEAESGCTATRYSG
ncbi:NgoMIV family type II restriction endonuclease [Nocardia niigatensis]